MPDYHNLLVAMTATNQRQGALISMYERALEKAKVDLPALPDDWVHPCQWRPTGVPAGNPKHSTPKWEEAAALAIIKSVLDFWPSPKRDLPEVKHLYAAMDAPGWLVSSILPRFIGALEAVEPAPSPESASLRALIREWAAAGDRVIVSPLIPKAVNEGDDPAVVAYEVVAARLRAAGEAKP